MRNFKLVVHVPLTHSDTVREAVGNAGGGQAGEYSHCSYTVIGKGRFKPSDAANPHIGTAGVIEVVEEEHIEVSQIPQNKVKDVINAMLDAHPYEETAYELIEIYKMEDLI